MLHTPVWQSGQVSFSDDGRSAYTIGTALVVTDGLTSQQYELGTYANLAPISPNGGSVAYNDLRDQIHVRHLGTQRDVAITAGPTGYFNPQWSPDGSRLLISSLAGEMLVYDMVSRKVVSLGTGIHPAWSPDAKHIVFARYVTDGTRLTNSDLYVIASGGGSPVRVTFTDAVCEMEPSFSPDGTLLYHTYTRREIASASFVSNGTLAARVIASLPSHVALSPAVPSFTSPAQTQLDIPYVHQLYDTPDWFNGNSACAPTQAIMLLAYYHVLPPWNITCSWPTQHVTAWGNYVADKYHFREQAFAGAAEDPNGVVGYGGYGYMWASGSPYTHMADYYRVHGLAATQLDNVDYSVALGEVAAGYPFSMCVLLTSAGHLVLAHGLGAKQGTFVFNDPYGDKNRGYANYYGKNVQYDWPGYSNGFQNLVQVAWTIATRCAASQSADTLVDDLQFSTGFTLGTSAPASMWLWRDLLRGMNGHMWYTSTRAGSIDTCYASWKPELKQDGRYEVFAYIPLSNATAARYVVTHAGGTQAVEINQKLVTNAWVSLGTFPFLVGGDGFVKLGDASAYGGQEIVFDALRWSYRGPLTGVATGEALPVDFRLEQNSPNPFNPATRITYSLATQSHVSLEIWNLLGERIAVLESALKPAGRNDVTWNAAGLPSGVFFCRLTAEPAAGGEAYVATRKMVLVK
jgi:hypothetical protein